MAFLYCDMGDLLVLFLSAARCFASLHSVSMTAAFLLNGWFYKLGSATCKEDTVCLSHRAVHAQPYILILLISPQQRCTNFSLCMLQKTTINGLSIQPLLMASCTCQVCCVCSSLLSLINSESKHITVIEVMWIYMLSGLFSH